MEAGRGGNGSDSSKGIAGAGGGGATDIRIRRHCFRL